MNERHLVVGAGPVGRATAQELVSQGHEVTLASRSGAGPDLPGVERVALDAADADGVTAAARNATAVYNCVNPPAYDKWPTLWPPMAEALQLAAERTGAVLVTTGNLYPYGPVAGPMVEGLPDAGAGTKARVRAKMWADALAAHEDGRLRAVEVRGSDYVGTGVGESGVLTRVVPRALEGKPVRVIGDPDQPHAWTDVRDMARALVAVAGREDTWGRVWHAPTNPPRTQREALADVCRAVGRKPVEVRGYPRAVMAAGALVSPLLRELKETAYQFDRPFVLDSSAITREIGLEPTPWEEVCRRTAGLEYCPA